ncbi:MAG: formate dehydrogenase accessory sulfurtransferase FdhD [Alphaproteobacteria bacterium]|nr:formate dehydrogenase accessory sulfurtransferase FdhD [Alphaproteobacteria bacterium]
MTTRPAVGWQSLRVRRDGAMATERVIPDEVAVAFTYGRSTYAVMMATPASLEDFALGFSLNEGVIDSPAQLTALDVVRQRLGIELRMELAEACDVALFERRRAMTGPAGCGLCGIESLAAAMRPLRRIESPVRVPAGQIFAAMEALHVNQPLNAKTRALHAAAFWSVSQGQLVAVREDVGRHNALDKLCGAVVRCGVPAQMGIVVMTSRISIELVQKTTMLGAGILAAVSVPTAQAVREAENANLTLVAVARDDSFEVFTHHERILC